jgi:hypothetical protein
MDIPDTKYWCMYSAALWIITRSLDVRDAVLDAELKPPTNALLNDQQCRRYNALTWLEEHKSAMRPKYREWHVEKALELAFDELAQDIWFELACENVREMRAGHSKSFSELRAEIEYKKMSQLQNVGGLKRLAGFCASQAGIFGNFRNFWRCCVDFGRSFSVACPRLTELNWQRSVQATSRNSCSAVNARMPNMRWQKTLA